MNLNPTYCSRVVLSALSLLLLISCGRVAADKNASIVVPDITVVRTASDLHKANGLLYRNDTLFSGIVVENYPDGGCKSSTPYYQGREEGSARGWYPDGTPMFERTYLAGKKEGTHRGWWENGEMRFLYHFEKDKNEGRAQDWFSDGATYKDFHYKNGQEDGAQQMWNEDGTVQANYVVIDGRRYGSMGSKPCRSSGVH